MVDNPPVYDPIGDNGLGICMANHVRGLPLEIRVANTTTSIFAYRCTRCGTIYTLPMGE